MSQFDAFQALEREQTRLETLARIRSELGIRLMRFAQPDIIGICLALAPLELPPYVLLWIVDWLPRYDLLSHHKKIHLIESVVKSIRKLKGSQSSILCHDLFLSRRLFTISKTTQSEQRIANESDNSRAKPN